MPYYQCPKCSGRDTYEGTELVSGSSEGGAIIGPENDLGFSPVMKTGGKKTIDQVTVVKCKKCDIILGDKDLKYTEEEIDRAKAKETEEEERITKRDKLFVWLLIGVAVTAAFILVITGLMSLIINY